MQWTCRPAQTPTTAFVHGPWPFAGVFLSDVQKSPLPIARPAPAETAANSARDGIPNAQIPLAIVVPSGENASVQDSSALTFEGFSKVARVAQSQSRTLLSPHRRRAFRTIGRKKARASEAERPSFSCPQFPVAISQTRIVSVPVEGPAVPSGEIAVASASH